MCGICCVCRLAPASTDEKCPFLNMEYIESHSFVPHRGPDARESVTRTLWSGVPSLLAGFVLHLRGSVMTPQPLTNDDGDVLLWNGEIFGGIEVQVDENDTQILFRHLTKCTRQQDVLTVLQSVQGPWSFIFWQAKQERLWFGRDVFGRRSLLWHLPIDDDVFALSSVPIKPWEFEEVPSVGVFCLESSQSCVSNQESNDAEITQLQKHPLLHLHLYPWQRATWPGTEEAVVVDDSPTAEQKLHLDRSAFIKVSMHSGQAVDSWMPVLNTDIPDDDSLLSVDGCITGGPDLVPMLTAIEERGGLTALVKQLRDVLQAAVRKRVLNVPKSRGRHGDGDRRDDLRTRRRHENSVCDSPAGLNVCSEFQLPVVEGARSALSSSGCAVSKGTSSDSCSPFESGDHQAAVLGDSSGTEVSVSPRYDKDPLLPAVGENVSSEKGQNVSHASEQGCTADTGTDMHAFPGTSFKPASVAILFSGGVDSTVLAALADRCIPADEAIDLINVAFEQKVATPQPNRNRGKQAKDVTMTTSSYDVPDRQTGYLALAELNPERCWNFVEVNVTQEMLQKQRCERVRHLVYPLNTVLDDSIGCAVWFAARGSGVFGNGLSKGTPYVSTAKVILCGMGADEQLGGYSRHRVRFKQESWPGLIAEINMEIHRISARNLGRDDRIIADHGKESRFPFLDEDVVSFLASLPVHHKADLRFPRGVGEKLLLRLLALRLRLPCVSALPKRAIQFGSRIAKLERSKEKGNHVCQRLVHD